jgi:hypothetical protein
MSQYVVMRYRKDPDHQAIAYLVKNLSKGFKDEAWSRAKGKALHFSTKEDAEAAMTHIITTPGFHYEISEI